MFSTRYLQLDAGWSTKYPFLVTAVKGAHTKPLLGFMLHVGDGQTCNFGICVFRHSLGALVGAVCGGARGVFVGLFRSARGAFVGTVGA